ncbi:unnamed protein product [Dibothriocephalus latus]|uniref:Fibronectin type-III domain-containing protein n=1 Tax=Dibothriocephalus latus TaxID=60516 RepID=A0A3P7M1W4_DIBLA|nr:unnamed protein product [Dibothriocephalus latus]
MPEGDAKDVPVPKDFTATIVNSTTVRLTWKAPTISQPWGNKYLLTINNSTYTKSYTVVTTEETIINLQPSGVYNVTLQTLDTSDKPFPAKVFGSVQMPASGVPVPRKLTASVVDTKNIRVRWLPPIDTSQCGDKYQVIVRNATYQDKVMVTKTEYIISNLNPFSFYNVTVQATDKAGKPFPTGASVTVKFSTHAVPVPRDLTASIVNSNTLRVSWKAPSVALPWGNKYLLTVYNATYKRTYTMEKTEETITNLGPSSVYNFTVQCLDKNDKPFPAVAFGSARMPDQELPMEKPRDVTASAVNSTTIHVSWQKPLPADKFKDEYHITIYGEGYKMTYTTKDTVIIIGGLDTSSIYNITVQGVWANGEIVPDGATTTLQKPSSGNFQFTSTSL